MHPDLLDATPSLQLPFLPSIPTTTCPLGFVILTCQFHGKKGQRGLLEQLTEKAERRLILVMSLAKIFFWSLGKLKGKYKATCGSWAWGVLVQPTGGKILEGRLVCKVSHAQSYIPDDKQCPLVLC